MIASLLAAAPSQAMIFGTDDRLERHELPDTTALAYSRSTAALVLTSHLRKNSDQSYSINWDAPGTGRAKSDGACANTFEGQPELISYCSSTLIAPDLLLTSGHCFYRGSFQTPEQVCKGSVAVFDYSLDQPSADPVHFSTSQVYACKKLEIYSHEGDLDFAVVRLDRKVSGREIFRTATPDHSVGMKVSQSYWTSGYPRGLPNKTILNAKYFDFWGNSNFSALFQMEVMGGSSGSSVIDPVTRRIVGLVASSDCSELEWSETNRCFYEPVFNGQCRGVRVILLENLGISWIGTPGLL